MTLKFYDKGLFRNIQLLIFLYFFPPNCKVNHSVNNKKSQLPPRDPWQQGEQQKQKGCTNENNNFYRNERSRK